MPVHEYFVLVPSSDPNKTSQIVGPFRYGVRRSDSARSVAEKYAAGRAGAVVLGPFDPKKAPSRGRAMAEEKTEKTPAMIEHMFKELERPAKILEQWEQDFLYSVHDQFSRKRSLSDRQFEVLERIYARATA